MGQKFIMSYKVEWSVDEYGEVLRDTIRDWTKEETDVHLVSIDGSRIFSHRSLLCFYSHQLQQIFSDPSLALSTSPLSISIPASSSSIFSVLRLLVTGRSNIMRRSDLVEVKDTARLLGINLDNCVFDGEREETEVPPVKSVNKFKSDNREITSKNFKKEQKKETLVAHDSDQSASYKCDVCNSVF